MNYNINQQKFKNNTGFTLIELVISIFILSIAIIGISNAFYIITVLTSDSTDRLEATYLAQEGMEIVRNIRDANWLNMDAYCKNHTQDECKNSNRYSWVDGINICVNGCEADYTTGTGLPSAFPIEAFNAGKFLYINSSGFYGYNTIGATPTKFMRKIIINPVTDGDASHIVKVRTEVTWNTKATVLNPVYVAGTCNEGKNCIVVEETLYNWYFPNH